MAHAAVCEERHPADSEECQHVQELGAKRYCAFALWKPVCEGRYVKPDYKLAIKWLEKAGTKVLIFPILSWLSLQLW